MDAAYDQQLWHEFAVMVGGASAALAGLIGVALSISVDQILANAYLPRRAGAALIMTITPLLVAVVLLVPNTSKTALGVELLVIALLAALALGVAVSARSPEQPVVMWAIGTLVPVALLVVSTVLAGAGVISESLGGLYWVPIAVVAALLGGVLHAWVLLIEIRR